MKPSKILSARLGSITRYVYSCISLSLDMTLRCSPDKLVGQVNRAVPEVRKAPWPAPTGSGRVLAGAVAAV
jgi:hypothetical protein